MKKTLERKREGALSALRSPLPTRIGGRRRSHGFTLIEMLVVIVIIVILMGVVFKLSKGAMEKNTSASEMKRVAILRTLIEEFHAEYGTYPPVHEYEIDGKLVQPVNFTGASPLDGDAGDLNYYPGHYPKSKKYFTFGLMSFFVPRDEYCQKAFDVAGKNHGTINKQWEDEGCNDPVNGQGKISVPSKDKAFAKHVRPILEQIYKCYTKNVVIDPDNGHSKGFNASVGDSWGNEYVYISKPPYTTYLIFSTGPDGDYDREYPGDRAREKNRDNIYGNLGDK